MMSEDKIRGQAVAFRALLHPSGPDQIKVSRYLKIIEYSAVCPTAHPP